MITCVSILSMRVPYQVRPMPVFASLLQYLYTGRLCQYVCLCVRQVRPAAFASLLQYLYTGRLCQYVCLSVCTSGASGGVRQPAAVAVHGPAVSVCLSVCVYVRCVRRRSPVCCSTCTRAGWRLRWLTWMTVSGWRPSAGWPPSDTSCRSTSPGWTSSVRTALSRHFIDTHLSCILHLSWGSIITRKFLSTYCDLWLVFLP